MKQQRTYTVHLAGRNGPDQRCVRCGQRFIDLDMRIPPPEGALVGAPDFGGRCYLIEGKGLDDDERLCG